MRVLRLLLVPLVLVITCPPASAASQTCRLGRCRRPSPIAAGLLPAVLTAAGQSGTSWRIELRGHWLVFTLPPEGVSLLTTIAVRVDDREPADLTGMTAVADGRMVIDFSPVTIMVGDRQIPLLARLESYRSEVAKHRWDQAQPDAGPFPEPALKVEYESALSGWLLSAGNAQAFSGPMRFGSGRLGQLWLLDADLDGEFGEFADCGHGDLLAWEYETSSFLLGRRRLRGEDPLASRVRLADRRYGVRLEWLDQDTILLELTEL